MDDQSVLIIRIPVVRDDEVDGIGSRADPVLRRGRLMA
jgi:hypothetical protein